MTKKDFELIASVIADCEAIVHSDDPVAETDGTYAIELLAGRMSAALAKGHPRFDAARFEKYALPIKSAALRDRILAKLEGQS
jgi:hypothetical protein